MKELSIIVKNIFWLIVPLILLISLKMEFLGKVLIGVIIFLSFFIGILSLVMLLEKTGKLLSIIFSNAIFILASYLLLLFFGRLGFMIKYVCEGFECFKLIPVFAVSFVLFLINSFFIVREFPNVELVPNKFKKEKIIFWVLFVILDLFAYFLVIWLSNKFFLSRIIEGLGLILMIIFIIISFFIAKIISKNSLNR